MREMERDGEHIWLRQSVTFTAAGQTRTVEIAIPLRPGASAEDVEALLSEADAGMERLSRRLDDRVSALLNGSPAPAVTPAETLPPAQAAAPVTPNEPRQAEQPPQRMEAPTKPPTKPPAHAAPSGAAAATPSEAAPARPAAPAPSRPAAQPDRPPSPVASSPVASSPSRARHSGPLADAQPTPQEPDITRPEFIAAAQELGLNVKQAMDRLGVRSLEGLNLREALEVLRRQAVRDDAAPVASARSSSPATPAAPAPRRAAPEPRYFDEEDDLDVTFSVEGEDELEDDLEEEAAPYAAGTPSGEGAFDPLEELDEGDLDDVPDFGPPPSASRGAPSASRRSHAATPQRAAAPAPVADTGDQDISGAGGDRARALQILGQLRAAHGGGAPTSYQRTAYRNIVARELGEPEAAALVRGVWRTTPERLTAEQLDALVSWGKQDTFGEEAALVLATLRADRERTSSTGSTGSAGDRQQAASAPRPTVRGRSAGSAGGAGSGRSAPGGD